MEKKPIVRITQSVELRKPIRIDGYLPYGEALIYMARTTAQDNPDFKILWNLASYALYGKLSEKQSKIADDLIEKYETLNPNVFYESEIKGEML